MEERRPDPDVLLKQIQREEQEKEKKKKGKLKIFLGYAAGTGKTYTMLEAAHEAAKHGIDVVAGYIEPHARPDTIAMEEGLEELPYLLVEYKGVKLREFHLDAALERKPALVLVDELAHTNAPGCRHEKRYQDVEELLRHGISVYSTLNIQHMESLNDLVENITGIAVRERIPDGVFDRAEQVEVIDIEPEELIGRMEEGKIYKQAQAERALQNFFRRDKLVALREIALRRTADRVNRIAEEERTAMGSKDYHTGEHVLACISPSPSNSKVIRAASRLAYAFHGRFTGLVVETPGIQESSPETKKILQSNTELAKALGGEIVSVFGEDVAGQIAEYAKVSNVSKIVIGKTNHPLGQFKRRSHLLERLTNMAPNVDVYIIPDLEKENLKRAGRKKALRKRDSSGIVQGIAVITGILSAVTVAALVLRNLHVPESNIVMLYMLAILISSYLVDRRSLAWYSALLGVLAFNFFCTEPYYSMEAYGPGYPLTFSVMFAVGFFAASLTNRLRRQNRENAKKAYRTEILLENSKKLRRCKSRQEVWDEVAGQVGKLLDLPVLVYPARASLGLENAICYPKKGMEYAHMEQYLTEKEKAVALWVRANGHRAGACTHTLPEAQAMYLPVRAEERVEGVIGIVLEERRPIQDFEYGLLIAMLNETAVKMQDGFLKI